ncbi:MAG: 4Fe-4S dicluster domain-containing protein [Proteobacteria bacterium]|nr:4Fe-4S dicluster domain-containing protein [Pseudomonadota bacterium]
MSSLSDRTEIRADSKKCKRCGSCEQACPSDVFAWAEDEIIVGHPGWCIKCGHCVASCPEGALEHSEMPADKFVPLPDKSPIDHKAAEMFFMQRRTCRRFEDKPVSNEEIQSLIDAARYAPTATNAQNIRFIIHTDRVKILKLIEKTSDYYLRLERQLKNPLRRLIISTAVGTKIANAYRYHMPAIANRFRKTLDGEDRLFYGAKAIIVVCAPGVLHLASAGGNLAAMEIMLAAEAMGLGTCYNGYALTAIIRDKKIRKLIDVPKNYHPTAVIAVGRPSGEFFSIPPRKKRRVIWF